MNCFTFETQIQPIRRVKEREVAEAIEKVGLWKQIINEGLPKSDGTMCKVTLNRAAEIIGIPKKTLEDYSQLFNKVNLLTDVHHFSHQKMGALRTYLRKNSKKLKKMLKDQKGQENVRKHPKSAKKITKAQKTLSNLQEQFIEQEQTGPCFFDRKMESSENFEQNPVTSKNIEVENQNDFIIKEEEDDYDYDSYQSPLGGTQIISQQIKDQYYVEYEEIQ